ncbi:NYN domain-containing protein [Jiangella anatolica]|nr:NYN domain-containing protein [Jiangella anatolica]
MEDADSKPTASVYIDGFNLYRRLLERHPEHKWLDLEALADRVLSDYHVTSVSYFTAIIKALPGKDSSSPQRQQAYLRALATSPRTQVYLGKFRIDPRIMPLHPTELDAAGVPMRVRVKKTEEKGSDVALASRLLIDAMKGEADVFVVCTNDSDLVMPMRLVKEELGRDVGLLSPMEPKRSSNELKQTGPIWHRQITPADLDACQLPDELDDAQGTIRRPVKWARNSEGPAEAEPSNRQPKPTGGVNTP